MKYKTTLVTVVYPDRVIENVNLENPEELKNLPEGFIRAFSDYLELTARELEYFVSQARIEALETKLRGLKRLETLNITPEEFDSLERSRYGENYRRDLGIAEYVGLICEEDWNLYYRHRGVRV